MAVLCFTFRASAQYYGNNQPTPTPPPVPQTWFGTENGKNYLYRNPPATKAIDPALPTPTPLKAEIITLATDRPYFHWGGHADLTRWEQQGLSDSEFYNLRTNGEGQAAGGGMYISEDFCNSSGYGSDCVAIRLTKNVRVVRNGLHQFFPDAWGNTQWMSQVLEGLGIDGTAYSNQPNFEWINLFKRSTMETFKPATLDDFLTVADKSYRGIAPWIQLIQKAESPTVKLDPQIDPVLHIDQVGKKFPMIQRYLQRKLSTQDQDVLVKELLGNTQLYTYSFLVPAPSIVQPTPGHNFYTDYAKSMQEQSSLLPRDADLKKQLTQGMLKHLPELKAKYVDQIYFYQMLANFVTYEKLGPYNSTVMTKNFIKLFKGSTGYYSGQAYNPSVLNFKRSLGMFEFANFVKTQAQQTGPTWTLSLEEKTLYDSWVNYRLDLAKPKFDAETDRIVKMNQTNAANGLPPYPLPKLENFFDQSDYVSYNTINQSLELTLEVAQRLTQGQTKEIRSVPLIAGGKHIVNGIGYYSVTEDQLNALKENPLLVVESIPDPNSKPGNKKFLARHEFPSARTYKRFQALLSPELQSDLIQAEQDGVLTHSEDERFRSLTKRVIQDLWKSQKQPGYRLTLDYRFGLALHPFLEQNETVFRFIYQLANGTPLLLRNSDWALLLNDRDLNYEVEMGSYLYSLFSSELSSFLINTPDATQFTDFRANYAYFFDIGDPLKIAKPNFVKEAQTFFNSPIVNQLIEDRMIFEQGDLTTSACSLLLTPLLRP